MITPALIALFLFVGLATCATTLYGVATLDTNAETTITSSLGSINPTNGQFTPLFDISTFFEAKVSVYGGPQAFDQKNKIMYYADNSDSDFVYALDVVNKKIIKVYSANSEGIFATSYDSGTGNIIIGGFYGPTTDLSMAFVFIPADGSSKSTFFNFTEELGGDPFAGVTVDTKNSIMYTVFGTSAGEKIAVIDIKTLTAHASPIINCNKFIPFELNWDETNSRLFAFGVQGSQWAYLEIDAKSFSCDVTNIALNSSIAITGYDPVSQNAYLVVDNGQIYTLNVQTKKLAAPLTLEYDILGFAVSYQ